VIQHPNNSQTLMLGIRMLREPKLLQTCCRLNGGVLLVERRVISLTDAATHTHTSTRQLHLHLHLPVEPTLFLLLPSRTTLVGESTMLPWKKHKKLLMLPLVCFSSTTLLQLCYLILEHHILSYLLHMLGRLICP
jgi:hypothetical protein